MKSLGKITEELINKSPFLREAMSENLINISSLARKLRPEIEKIAEWSYVNAMNFYDI